MRYLLGAPHYRSDLEWSDDAIADADASYSRIEGFLERAYEVVGDTVENAGVPAEFADAMDDDLAVPRAIGVLHETVRTGNTALAGGDKEVLAQSYASVVAMVGVLGLAPSDFGTGADESPLRNAVDGLVPAMLETREKARERRDFGEADRIRDALAAAGVVIEDTTSGPRWRLGR